MESYDFLAILAVILLSTKAFGLITEKVNLPQVVGALIAGIVLGPSCLGIVAKTDFLTKTAEIGVIILMFIAGLDTNIEDLKKSGLACFAVALLGVIIPLVLCGSVYYLFYADSFTMHNLLCATFVGVIFTATSVSITVETLNELGQLKSRVGNTLIGAAIIDDVLGIIALSVVTSFSGTNVNPAGVLIKIVLFFVFAAIVGYIVNKLFKQVDKNHGESRRVAVWGLAFCLIMSYAAEKLFGVADITGAYLAGLILCNISKTRKTLAKKTTVASYVFFSPVFFASIGVGTDISGINSGLIVFTVILLVMAIISKMIGCGLGAKICGLSSREALNVGIGMISRGEVAFMAAQKGMDAGLIEPEVFPAIVIAVVGATLITPILLKATMPSKSSETTIETVTA